MLKFLLILFLVVWILSKLGGFFFRAGAASQNRQYQRKPEGTMNTDGPPPKQKRSGNIKGGEYIDYEEVK